MSCRTRFIVHTPDFQRDRDETPTEYSDSDTSVGNDKGDYRGYIYSEDSLTGRRTRCASFHITKTYPELL